MSEDRPAGRVVVEAEIWSDREVSAVRAVSALMSVRVEKYWSVSEERARREESWAGRLVMRRFWRLLKSSRREARFDNFPSSVGMVDQYDELGWFAEGV